MFWSIEFYPPCTHHLFLSHSAEDREVLVLPVFEQLRAQGLLPWVDRHDYPYGRGSRAALRDSILTCRHTVFFVTPAMLTQSRGWCVQELAWAELLQDNLVHPGGPSLLNVTLPLYFVPPDDPRLPRSVWQTGRERGPFRPKGAKRVDWAVEQIVAFTARETKQAERFAAHALDTPAFRTRLLARSGVLERVTKFAPTLTPAPA